MTGQRQTQDGGPDPCHRTDPRTVKAKLLRAEWEKSAPRLSQADRGGVVIRILSEHQYYPYGKAAIPGHILVKKRRHSLPDGAKSVRSHVQ